MYDLGGNTALVSNTSLDDRDKSRKNGSSRRNPLRMTAAAVGGQGVATGGPDRPDVYDVVVVGGGPAGSSAAGLLALDGWNVLLLERDKFPRYHIGESLITGVWPTIDRLAMRERLAGMGFTKKYGATVRWGLDDQPWGFYFREAGVEEYAYQVPRAEFDTMLLGRARELGVTVLEEAAVRDPVLDGQRLLGVRYQLRGEESSREARASIVLDASGQRRWLGSLFGLVEWHEELRNTAVWAYFQRTGRYEGQDAGHTLVEHVNGGWFWFIPLADDTTSVGYVTPISFASRSGLPMPQLFEHRLEQSHEVRRLLEPSTRVTGYRTARDWSYTCRSFYGPGWVLVGDAAAFIDPLLSTGVTLAMRSARLVATAVTLALGYPALEARAFQAYEEDSRAFLKTILEFVVAFYDQTKRQADYHRDAQVLVDPDEENPAELDFSKLVSGLAEDGSAGDTFHDLRKLARTHGTRASSTITSQDNYWIRQEAND